MDDWEDHINLDKHTSAPALIVSEQSGPSSATIAANDPSDDERGYVVQRVTNHRLVRGRGITKCRPKYECKVL